MGPAGAGRSFTDPVNSTPDEFHVNRAATVAAVRASTAEGKPWAIEAAFEAAFAGTLARAGLSEPAPAGVPRAGPIASAAAARDELAEAGLTEAEAWEPVLHHPFERAAARALFVEYDRAADLDALAPSLRADVLTAFDTELDLLSDAVFRWDAPLVAARAVRPRDG